MIAGVPRIAAIAFVLSLEPARRCPARLEPTTSWWRWRRRRPEDADPVNGDAPAPP